ncbi:NAD(P)/FAD-dependent oxidoreductase [Thalassorhabdomicrobium marinisediminis]|uniref:Pyridine nucleotide-disulfide oxidoreductase n=1 Tax=Thalassorhabdomicrobium marinisediminis TaxID=2170577 RepID=A0A2T7FU64_9RHOB|nr:FAD/NAD(P)-binding oxidoreductase [Thalassorhabdomicrobium marinisediminis]PVA05703.1 pyridine nucleotide-disulfide oxidoreductase [Thalassorhabdomicrobium marinisediminis]
MAAETFTETSCTVAIVGGGTSGLALAAELMRLKVGRVVVLEREPNSGGIPRHCGHYPFGVYEYKRLMKGPDYARKNTDVAADLGAVIRTGTTVTALRPGGTLELTTPGGREVLHADRVVLCTGVRESSRAQRFINGDRPYGVISTGALQSLAYLEHIRPFTRPVIFGSELVSFSAIQTCAHLGIKPAALVEEEDHVRVRALLTPYLIAKRVPLFTGIRQPTIIGSDQVEAFEFSDKNGRYRRIETDGIIISGRFRPEAALLKASHLAVDRGTGGPVVDQSGRCSDPAYFATGNILRPAETSAFCWQEGVDTAARVANDLETSPSYAPNVISVTHDDPAIRFVVPQRIATPLPPHGMTNFYLGLTKEVRGVLEARAGGKTVWEKPIKSQPIRRLQFPLSEIVKPDVADDITFTLRKSK